MTSETVDTVAPWKCANPCCHHYHDTVGEELRRCCARVSSLKSCSAMPVVPPPLPASPSAPLWKSKATPVVIAAMGLIILLLVFLPKSEEKKNDTVKKDPVSLVSGNVVIPVEPEQAIQISREQIRRDVEALVVAGNRMMKMHRALDVALAESEGGLKAQENLEPVGRDELGALKRSKLIHVDGSIFEELAREKMTEINEETHTYLKTLERLAKIQPEEVMTQMTDVAGGLGEGDKTIAIRMAVSHYHEIVRYKALDASKISQDFKTASIR